MTDKQVMNIELTPEQVNIVLASLAKQPYEAVAAIVETVVQQARAQYVPPAPTEEEQPAAE